LKISNCLLKIIEQERLIIEFYTLDNFATTPLGQLHWGNSIGATPLGQSNEDAKYESITPSWLSVFAVK
jgi:hypothetical protein